MAQPKAYAPEHGQQYQILVRAYHEREYEHCDYAVDKVEKNELLKEYRMAYGSGFIFKTILLPKKYWVKKEEQKENRRLSLDDWKNIFRNLKDEGEEVEIIWLDAVPFDADGNPTGEVNEWVLAYETEVFEDGFKTEEEARKRLNYLENKLL